MSNEPKDLVPKEVTTNERLSEMTVDPKLDQYLRSFYSAERAAAQPVDSSDLLRLTIFIENLIYEISGVNIKLNAHPSYQRIAEAMVTNKRDIPISPDYIDAVDFVKLAQNGRNMSGDVAFNSSKRFILRSMENLDLISTVMKVLLHRSD